MWQATVGRFIPRASPISTRNRETLSDLKMKLLAGFALGLNLSMLIPIVVAAVDEADSEIIDEMEKMTFVNIVGTTLLGIPLLFPKKHRHVYDEHLFNMIKLIVLCGAFVFHIVSTYLFNGFINDANVKLAVALVIHFLALIAETFNIVGVYIQITCSWKAVKDNDFNVTNCIPLNQM